MAPRKGRPNRPKKSTPRHDKPDTRTGRPRDWAKWKQVALLRMLEATQEEAAQLAGVSARTVQRWETDPRWVKAQRAVNEQYLAALQLAARGAVLRSVKGGNAVLGLDVLSRIDPAFAPPKQRVDAKVEAASGVLLVPAPVDPDAWAKVAAQQQSPHGGVP